MRQDGAVILSSACTLYGIWVRYQCDITSFAGKKRSPSNRSIFSPSYFPGSLDSDISFLFSHSLPVFWDSHTYSFHALTVCHTKILKFCCISSISFASCDSLSLTFVLCIPLALFSNSELYMTMMRKSDCGLLSPIECHQALFLTLPFISLSKEWTEHLPVFEFRGELCMTHRMSGWWEREIHIS